MHAHKKLFVMGKIHDCLGTDGIVGQLALEGIGTGVAINTAFGHRSERLIILTSARSIFSVRKNGINLF